MWSPWPFQLNIFLTPTLLFFSCYIPDPLLVHFSSHLFMVSLEAQKFLLQGLYLSLQVSLIQGQLIQDPAQAIGVCFYQLSQGQLGFIPTKRSGSATKG